MEKKVLSKEHLLYIFVFSKIVYYIKYNFGNKTVVIFLSSFWNIYAKCKGIINPSALAFNDDSWQSPVLIFFKCLCNFCSKIICHNFLSVQDITIILFSLEYSEFIISPYNVSVLYIKDASSTC
jgi:hypothetical protein